MSKDFELLRKAELAGKRAPIVLRRENVPWFTGCRIQLMFKPA